MPQLSKRKVERLAKVKGYRLERLGSYTIPSEALWLTEDMAVLRAIEQLLRPLQPCDEKNRLYAWVRDWHRKLSDERKTYLCNQDQPTPISSRASAASRSRRDGRDS